MKTKLVIWGFNMWALARNLPILHMISSCVGRLSLHINMLGRRNTTGISIHWDLMGLLIYNLQLLRGWLARKRNGICNHCSKKWERRSKKREERRFFFKKGLKRNEQSIVIARGAFKLMQEEAAYAEATGQSSTCHHAVISLCLLIPPKLNGRVKVPAVQ